MCYKKLLQIRFWAYGAGCVGGVCGALVAYSYFFPDEAYQAFLRGNTKARSLEPPSAVVGLTSYLPFTSILDPGAAACVRGMTSLLALNLEPQVFNRFFAPKVVFEDSLLIFDGLAETKDGWHFLQHFFHHTSPVVVEVRENTANPNELHVHYSTDAQLRFVPVRYTFDSRVQLTLEDFERRKRIVRVQHRWYGGAIVSRRSGSINSVVGDIGDLARRWNGFWLSSFLTASAYVHEDANAAPRA